MGKGPQIENIQAYYDAEKDSQFTTKESRDVRIVLNKDKAKVEAAKKELEALTPMYREVLVMYHFEHLKYTEIAEILEVPLGTVMNRIFRARRQLRDALDLEGGEP